MFSACGAETTRAPDIILIVVDTMRADHMSLYGYDRETTPAIDRWAEGGTVFERASAGSSWTVPSVHMLLSGRYLSEGPAGLDEGLEPLASILRDHGYRTGGFVSNPLLNSKEGYDTGFDEYKCIQRPANIDQRNGWSSFELVEMGLEWWNANDQAPRFLYLHLFDPHEPFRPQIPKAFADAGKGEIRSIWEHLLEKTPEEYRDHASMEAAFRVYEIVRLYDTEILQADQGLDTLFRELERTGADKQTVVVLTSDHGEGLWQRTPVLGEPALAKGLPYPALYLGHGTQLYSEQVHVPLVMRGPGVPAAVRRNDMVTLVDTKPTILALAGIEAERTSGVDLFDDALHSLNRAIFSACSRSASITVDERWRLHVPAAYRAEKFGAEPELYDLEADPLELDPIDDPDAVARLGSLVAAWRSQNSRKAEAGAVSPEELAERRRLLQALGYADQVDPADSAEE